MNNTNTSTIVFLLLLTFMSHAMAYFTENVHQTITAAELTAKQQDFENSLNQTKLWEAIEGLPVGVESSELSESVCREHLTAVDSLLEDYFYSIQLQKLVMDCHNLLDKKNMLKHMKTFTSFVAVNH